MLTASQYKTLEVIKAYVREHNISPTIAEIAEQLGLKSRSAVHRNLQKIEEEGYINILPNRRRNIELLHEHDNTLPLLGKIAAGSPIEAIENHRTLDIMSLFGGENRYVLEVKGDSMIEDNICDGDYVICEKAANARNGTIVVALVDQQEATLKRFYNNADGTVTLVPANANMKPMVFSAEQVGIQGIFVGLLRIN